MDSDNKVMLSLRTLKIVLIASCLVVGAYLPVRLVELKTNGFADYMLDIFISLTAALAIFVTISRKKLAWNDLNTWKKPSIILDWICFLPLCFIDHITVEYHYLLLIDLLLVRHVTLIKSTMDEFPKLDPFVYRLTPLIVALPLLIHLLASGWVLLGSGNVGPNSDRALEYLKAVYWTITTLTTVGYGDISPSSPVQMMYACLVQITGVGVFGFILSNIASLLSHLDANRVHHMEHLGRVETFMQSHGIPNEARWKVRDYFNYLWVRHKGYRDQSIIHDLPRKFQSELLYIINKPIVDRVPLFKDASREFLEDLMRQLEPHIFVPDEKIFKVDEPGTKMYFITNGVVQILSKDNVQLALLKDGDFFGEMSLIYGDPRSASAKAFTYCDLYSLDKEIFDRAVADYPEFRKSIQKVIDQRKSV